MAHAAPSRPHSAFEIPQQVRSIELQPDGTVVETGGNPVPEGTRFGAFIGDPEADFPQVRHWEMVKFYFDTYCTGGDTEIIEAFAGYVRENWEIFVGDVDKLLCWSNPHRIPLANITAVFGAVPCPQIQEWIEATQNSASVSSTLLWASSAVLEAKSGEESEPTEPTS